MDGVNTGVNTNLEDGIAIGLDAYQGPLDTPVWLDEAAAAPYGVTAGYYLFSFNDNEDGYWLTSYHNHSPEVSLSLNEATTPQPTIPEGETPETGLDQEDAPQGPFTYADQPTSPASASSSSVPASTLPPVSASNGGASGTNGPVNTIKLVDEGDRAPRLLALSYLEGISGITPDLTDPSVVMYTVTLTIDDFIHDYTSEPVPDGFI